MDATSTREIQIRHLEKTAVQVPTEEEFKELMHVLYMGKCLWRNGTSLISQDNNHWNCYESDTCVATDRPNKKGGAYVMYESEFFCWELGYKVISLEDFYREQEITPQEVEEIRKSMSN